jgi:hypothetical protein
MSTLKDIVRQTVREELVAQLQDMLADTRQTMTAQTQEIWASDPEALRRPWPDDLFQKLETYAVQNADAGETHTVGDWLHLIGQPNVLHKATPGDKRAFSLGMKRIGFHLGRSAANVILSRNGQNVFSWLAARKADMGDVPARIRDGMEKGAKSR